MMENAFPQERQKVDIFSHFERLIGEQGSDGYRRDFEENNLLVNIGYYPNGFHPHQKFMENKKSYSSSESPILNGNVPEISGTNDKSGSQEDRKIWSEVQAIVYSSGSIEQEQSFSVHQNFKPEVRKTIPVPKTKCYPSRPPMLPPCRVCGDTASGFHYGVNTCEACKGFFRRSIVKATPYACVNSGDCKLILGRRTSCSACRYKRCLEVGMSKHAIKTGRYTHELRSKNILEVKRLEKQNKEERSSGKNVNGLIERSVESATQNVSVDSGERLETKNDELESILQRLLEGQTNLYEFLDEYYDTELMLARQRAVYERYLADKAKRELWEKLYGSGCCAHTDMNERSENVTSNIGENCENRSTTSIGDQQGVECPTILEGRSESYIPQQSPSISPADESIQGSCYDKKIYNTIKPKQNIDPSELAPFGKNRSPTEALKAEVLTRFLEDMKRGVNGMLAFSKSIPGFEDLPNEDQVALVQAARLDIWFFGHIRCFNHELLVGACEWKFHAEELSKVWGEELVKKTFDLSKVGLTLDLNKEEIAALRGLSVSFTDRCYPLKDVKAVERIHEKMMEVLKYTVLKRHPDFNAWFSQVIRFLINIREVGELYVKFSSNLKLEWSVLENNPTLLEVFLS